MTTRSIHEPARCAASVPSGIATAIAIAIVTSAIESVGSIRCASSSVTGTWVKIDVPRSPCARRPAQSANWRQSGWSRPSAVRSRAMSSVLARSPAISAAGSPGERWMSRKTSSATTAMTGSVAAMRRKKIPMRGAAIYLSRAQSVGMPQYLSRFLMLFLAA